MTILPTIDLLRPFQLERSHLRGRFVRLGDTVDLSSRHMPIRRLCRNCSAAC